MVVDGCRLTVGVRLLYCLVWSCIDSYIVSRIAPQHHSQFFVKKMDIIVIDEMNSLNECRRLRRRRRLRD